MLKLKNIKKSFQNNAVLNDITLDIPEKCIYGIIGRSGAGKSTLIRCINLLEKPDSGSVLINDIDITTQNTTKLREYQRNIGMIFQHFNLLASRTVFENVAFPLELRHEKKKNIQDKVEQLLELTQLTEKKNHYPSQLSGGQKQRTAIARALVYNPSLLLCDEATSSLDPNTTQSILDLLKDINKKLGLTIILITHEMDVIRSICDYVAVIDQGVVVEKNTTENIFSEPQHDLTKQFLCRTHNNIEKLKQLKMKFLKEKTERDSLILELTFNSQIVLSPVITQIARKFDVDINILEGTISEVNKTNQIGYLLIEVLHSHHHNKQIIEEFCHRQIHVEVVRNGES